jgi:hypothetical protein
MPEQTTFRLGIDDIPCGVYSLKVVDSEPSLCSQISDSDSKSNSWSSSGGIDACTPAEDDFPVLPNAEGGVSPIAIQTKPVRRRRGSVKDFIKNAVSSLRKMSSN